MSYRMCGRCVIDSTVPGANFDAQGQCSYCRLHDLLEKEYPLSPAGEAKLARLVEAIKADGRGKKYDCVAGISGGRDSTFTLYTLVKRFGLRPLAVHFNDGFGNPTAGENMIKATSRLGVELRTITSDWRESKDLKLAFLRASTPDLEQGTDVGIATSLYGTAAQESLRYVLLGQSFRTEGVAPLEWNYLDGRYLKNVHRMFGKVSLRPWSPTDPGFNLGLREMFYYGVVRQIKVVPILYYVDYVRAQVDELLVRELDWVNTGAHYLDDLYQTFYSHVLRVKFGIDRRRYNWAALVRSGQMDRQAALDRLEEPNRIEDPDLIRLCVKRLGLSQAELEEIMALPPKTFRDYPTSYQWIKRMQPLIWLAARLRLIPHTAYAKYFWCD